MIPSTSPDDEELQNSASDFMLASMRCYVHALRRRAKVSTYNLILIFVIIVFIWNKAFTVYKIWMKDKIEIPIKIKLKSESKSN